MIRCVSMFTFTDLLLLQVPYRSLPNWLEVLETGGSAFRHVRLPPSKRISTHHLEGPCLARWDQCLRPPGT